MPRLPSALVRKFGPQTHKKERSGDADQLKSDDVLGPFCWPWVIGTGIRIAAEKEAFEVARIGRVYSTDLKPTVHTLQYLTAYADCVL